MSFSAPPSSFPAFSLHELGAADAGTLLRRRGRRLPSPRPPRAASARVPATRPCTPAPPDPPGSDAPRPFAGLRRHRRERRAAAHAQRRPARFPPPPRVHPAAAPPAPPCASPVGCPGCGRASPHRRRAVGGRQRRHRRGHGPGARPGQKQRSAPPLYPCQVGPTVLVIRGGFIYFC